MSQIPSIIVPLNIPFDPPTVSIITAPLTTDEDANYEEQVDGIFSDYLVVHRYEKDPQKYMVPVTSPTGFQGQSCAFVQLAAPTLLWIADWTAKKSGDLPEIPDPNLNDPNWVLLDDHYDLNSVELLADGMTAEYRISGTYVYGHRNPDAQTHLNLLFPQPPWIRSGFLSRTIPASRLKQGIINTGTFG